MELLKNLTDKLNPAQIEAVTSIGSPLLIVAGAGSGKTRVITYRIAYLIGQGVRPWNILAVTFTNKAAEEMKSRIYRILGKNIELNIGTFHSICVRILRSEIKKLRFKSNFVIYDKLDQLTLIRQICKGLDIDNKANQPKNIASRISMAKNKLQTADIFKGHIDGYFDYIVSTVYDVYEKRMKVNNALDFDDIILHSVRILQMYPDILKKYQKRFRYILVDEYQDTNYSQYRLIKLLSGDGDNLCVVGDPDQSIYGWRGADISNILRFEEDHSNTKIICLEQNYRSTQGILSASNKMIKNNMRRKPKNLWTQRDFGEPIYVYTGENEKDEAMFVVNKIKSLKKEHLKLSDIVVFYRTHAQSRIIEKALGFEGIPYDIVGDVSFYERKEVKDIIAYLTMLVCPEDEIALRRIINVPARGIGKGAINTIAETAKKAGKTFNQAVWDSVKEQELPSKIREKVRRFALLINELRQMAVGLRPPALIRRIIEKNKYFDELKKKDEISAQTRIENVEELVSAAEDFNYNSEMPALPQFLEGIALVSEIDEWEESDEKVTLMTLHCAKGLEFEAVIMVGMEEGLFPHFNSSDSAKEIEEERRLCYVGMTRAKSKLFMSCVECRMRYGHRVYSEPSRFLQEIPEELMQINYRHNINPSYRRQRQRY